MEERKQKYEVDYDMSAHHFEVETNRQLYKFEEQCNKIKYDHDKYLMFFNSNEAGDRLLAMFPHESIRRVFSVKNSTDK